MSRAKIAIFAALADEIRIIRSKMQIDESVLVRPARIVRGQLSNIPLIMVRTGIGKTAMAEAALYCIKHYNPELCLNVGYCGGADPHMNVGDLLVADRIVDAGTVEEFVVSEEVVTNAKKKCDEAGLRYSVGGMITVDEAVSGPHDKAFMGTRYDVRGIEMESAAFARICEEQKVPYAVVRAVLDPMDMRLPDFKEAVDDEGETSIFGAIKHMIKHPKDIAVVPRIEYCAIQARETIAKFIDAWLGISEE